MEGEIVQQKEKKKHLEVKEENVVLLFTWEIPSEESRSKNQIAIVIELSEWQISANNCITIHIAKTDPDALIVVIILEFLNQYKGGGHDGKVNAVEVPTVMMTKSTQEAKTSTLAIVLNWVVIVHVLNITSSQHQQKKTILTLYYHICACFNTVYRKQWILACRRYVANIIAMEKYERHLISKESLRKSHIEVLDKETNSNKIAPFGNIPSSNSQLDS
ncbi:hypothetical protein RFI_39250 [Reticulomyxa filosa]|uniref:Uncharacterized protein n=1 Tax=Reticulomyxa filosa TaxID=46433 RepID=X6LA68_RETFI|nr:hypothetical protein RFI_39250 [Reticulomyxa filosa]|eukprot:ETN98260.1 hypothetical protein RFI_39250 [Reticulomyxa filosa]